MQLSVIMTILTEIIAQVGLEEKLLSTQIPMIITRIPY